MELISYLSPVVSVIAAVIAVIFSARKEKREDFTAVNEGMKNLVEGMQAEIDILNKKFSDLEKDYATVKAERDILSAEVKRLKQESGVLETQIKLLQKEKDLDARQIREFATTIERLNERIAQLEKREDRRDGLEKTPV
ncbi:MAG: hypothetical protein HUU10_04450 [Bacteroidetes bacterium]|nr:hypothetical protein [Bacteroidota bacterium]